MIAYLQKHKLQRSEENMADTTNLPRWQSHKVVHAAAISQIKLHNGQITALVLGGADGSERVVTPAPNMFARYTPVEGDYYVVYDDGYASISPRQAFEIGYHRL